MQMQFYNIEHQPLLNVHNEKNAVFRSSGRMPVNDSKLVCYKK